MNTGITKTQEKGIKRIINATGYSINGLKAAWKYEAAFRQETILAIGLLILAAILPTTKVEKLALIASVVLVVIVELINSAIEAVVDRVSTERHELSGRAKDMGSAAVFLSLGLMLFTWVFILFFR